MHAALAGPEASIPSVLARRQLAEDLKPPLGDAVPGLLAQGGRVDAGQRVGRAQELDGAAGGGALGVGVERIARHLGGGGYEEGEGSGGQGPGGGGGWGGGGGGLGAEVSRHLDTVVLGGVAEDRKGRGERHAAERCGGNVRPEGEWVAG